MLAAFLSDRTKNWVLEEEYGDVSDRALNIFFFLLPAACRLRMLKLNLPLSNQDTYVVRPVLDKASIKRECSIVIAGYGGVGKSAFVCRVIANRWVPDYDPTIGADHRYGPVIGHVVDLFP